MPHTLEEFRLYYEELASAARLKQFNKRKKVRNGKNTS